MKNKILVLSYRRSGTHFTIDTLLNNIDFDGTRKFRILVVLTRGSNSEQELNFVKRDEPVLFKSRSVSNTLSYIGTKLSIDG